jgi:hypothetical protein
MNSKKQYSDRNRPLYQTTMGHEITEKFLKNGGRYVS